MSTRILVTLESDADPDGVVQALYDAGAETVTPPQPELPDVAIATFADEDADASISTIRSLHGVRVAETDAWRDASVDDSGSGFGGDIGFGSGSDGGGVDPVADGDRGRTGPSTDF